MKRYIQASRGNAFVGIWWYTDGGEIWGVQKPVDDAVLDGNYLQYSDEDNHETIWKSIVRSYVEDEDKQNEVISKGYKSLERGRVIYNTMTQVFEIICSGDLIENDNFKSKVVEFYKLSGYRYEFPSFNALLQSTYNRESLIRH